MYSQVSSCNRNTNIMYPSATSSLRQQWLDDQEYTFHELTIGVEELMAQQPLRTKHIMTCLTEIYGQTKAVLTRNPHVLATAATKDFVQEIMNLVTHIKNDPKTSQLCQVDAQLAYQFSLTTRRIQESHTTQIIAHADRLELPPSAAAPFRAKQHGLLKLAQPLRWDAR